MQVLLAGSLSSVLLDGLSSQTLYHVSLLPLYADGAGPGLRGTVTTCKPTQRLRPGRGGGLWWPSALVVLPGDGWIS